MFRWYAIHTYSGHEDKVRRNLEQRRRTQQGGDDIRRIVVPTEQTVETRDGKKVEKESRVLPGYVLVQMDATPECISLVRNTPGVTGFVGAQGKREEMTLVPLAQAEIDKLAQDAGFKTWTELFTARATPPQNPERPTMAAWMPVSRISDPVFNLRRNPYFVGVDPEGNQLP